jgi:hypothetical protein
MCLSAELQARAWLLTTSPLISLLLGSHREQEQHEDHQQQHYSYDSEW